MYRCQRLAGVLVLTFLFGCSHTTLGRDELVPESDLNPSWSPTGRFVAYFHLEPGENLSSLSGLYTLDLRTGTRKLLYPMLPNTVSWSPDETHLVFGDGNGLRTIRIDGE